MSTGLVKDMPDISKTAARALDRCAELARYSEREGQLLRRFLSPPMDECHRLLRSWMEAAGVDVTVDLGGNIRGYYAAENEPAPRLLIGSHLDTVPNAGAYDGVLGVVLGLALVEEYAGRRLAYGIEVIGFSDEEGVRYGTPFLGSRAVTKTLDAETLARHDEDGIPMTSALEEYASRHPDAMEAELHSETRAYLEFHIEQGPVLENLHAPLGVVEAIVGQSRLTLCFQGHANHAGTTPMHLRKDALAAAAAWIVRVEAIASAHAGLVATVGRIECEPGAANVIPGNVRCTLDVRHASDDLRNAAVNEILRVAEEIAAARKVHVEWNQYLDQAAVRMDPAIVAIAEHAVKDAGFPVVRMTSGAGHDAMIMAPYVPSAMIFLRSPGGISHHPDESVMAEDVAAALKSGICFLARFEEAMQKAGIEKHA